MKQTFKFWHVASLLLCLMAVQSVKAQTVVLDADDNFPVCFASVFNQDGKFLGQTTVDGILPDLQGAKTIRITHIAYESLKAKASGLGKELRMKPVTLTTAEAVIAKPKTHCVRLTGFLRNYALSNQLYEDDDPVHRFYEGVGQLYIFLDGKKSNEWVDIAARDGRTQQMVEKQKSVRLGLKSKSLIEKIKNSEKIKTRDANGYQQILYNDTVIGTIVNDTDNQIIRSDIDYLYPDTVRVVNLVLLKLRVTELKENYIYTMADDYVSQGNLRKYCSFHNAWTKALGKMIEVKGFDEFYVEKADFLTQEEYKEAVKESKAQRKTNPIQMTSEQLDHYMVEHNIPAIPEELQNSLAISRKIQQKKADKKKKN